MVRRIKQDRWKLWVVQAESREFLRWVLDDLGPRLRGRFLGALRLHEVRIARYLKHPEMAPLSKDAGYLHQAYGKKRKGRKKW